MIARRFAFARWPRSGLWGHGDFLRLWSAQTISAFGSQVSALALPFVAISVLDASAFQVAALSTVEFLPFVLFSLPAGVWVDRLARRPILIISDWGRGVALATIPIAYGLDNLTIWQLYAVGFLVGTLTVLFDVAYQSYLPSLVERAQLAEGNSKLEVTRSGAQIGGPGVAGVLIGVLTAPFAVVLDAASFAVSALLITRINGHEVVERVASASRSMRREIAEGLRFVLSHPYMRPSLSYVAISNFFTSGLFAIFLVYAVRNLGMSAAQAGLIFSIGHVGNLAGAVGRSSGRGAPRDRTDHHRCRCARQLGVPPYTSRPRLNA